MIFKNTNVYILRETTIFSRVLDMRARAGILLIIGLVLLAGTTAWAADPFIISKVNTSKEFPIANGVDTAIITISVQNSSTFAYVEGATVTFTVDSGMGSMIPSSVTTDVTGTASATFRVSTRSGTAHINATAQYDTLVNAIPTNIDQNIDHDSPYVPIFSLPASGTVKSEVPLTITFTDRWGNLIDSRNPAEIHTVSLHVHGPSPDDCGFVEGATLPHDVSKTLDANGNISAIISLTSRAGSNNVLLDRFGSIPDKMRSIVAISNAVPHRMDAMIDPSGSPPTVIADGTSQFTLRYILYDEFDNPTVGQPLNFSTSEPRFYPDQLTMANGDVWYTFGPKSFTGSYELTAKAVNNPSVTNTMTVRFYNSSPSNVEITANPQSMASRDANPGVFATVRAKIVDIVGNPVSGESVTFTLHSIEYTPAAVGYDASKTPSFDPDSEVLTVTATTNADGIASVLFYPTKFAVLGEPGYEQSATGTGKITAKWNDIERDVSVTWKNYPYLSADLTITPAQVTVGDTIDINLKLSGDGWALTSKPIDVVMVTDRSGSMMTGLPDRMVGAKAAAKIFNLQMNDNQDRVGLVSYGRLDYTAVSGWADLTGGSGFKYPSAKLAGDDSTSTDDAAYAAVHYPANPKYYGYALFPSLVSYASLDLPLTINPVTNQATVESAIDSMVPAGGTPMRDGLYLGVKHLIDNKRTGAVNAVILLADGDNDDGYDPRVGGHSFTEIGSGSVIDWAVANDIRIYTIAFGTSANEAKLEGYATDTRGFYRYAPDSDKLAEIYTDIAGDLRESAGVDTNVVMDFGSIVINDQLDTSGNVFAYVADPETDGVTNVFAGYPANLGSTMVRKYNETDELIPGEAYSQVGPLWDNMTPYWNANKQLFFDVGTVKLHETWETNFRMRVLKEGSINLMGPNSIVTFTDAYDNPGATLKLENLSSFTATQSTVFTGATWQTITISEFKRTDTVTGDGPLTSSLPVTWTTTYTGFRPVTHDVYYIHDSDPPVRFAQIVTTGVGQRTLFAQLDMTTLPPGGYQIRVHAHAADADAIDTIGFWPYNTQTRAFIKLE